MVIRNLRKKTDLIHEKIRLSVLGQLGLCSRRTLQPGDIQADIEILRTSIEKRCAKMDGSAADLSTAALRTYLLLRFLDSEEYLAAHLAAVENALEAIRRSKKLTTAQICNLKVRLDFSGYLYRRRKKNEKHVLQINEAFLYAPNVVWDAIAAAAFARRKSKKVEVVRQYTQSAAFEKMNRAIRGRPIPNLITCRGDFFDLAELYEELNETYFQGNLVRPRLIWSSRTAKRRLGYFHQEIHTIAINGRLDSENTPKLLTEYVLYHEMLHQHHGITNHNGRRYAHTSAFRADEKKFRQYRKAESLIKHLH